MRAFISALGSPYNSFLFFMFRPHPTSTLFPYTTLFRSKLPSASPKRPTTTTRPIGQASATDSNCARSEEHTSELQSLTNLVCRLLLEKKNETVSMPRRHALERGSP